MFSILSDNQQLAFADEETLERMDEMRESDDDRRERIAERMHTPRCPRCGHELIARPRRREVRYHCGCERAS